MPPRRQQASDQTPRSTKTSKKQSTNARTSTCDRRLRAAEAALHGRRSPDAKVLNQDRSLSYLAEHPGSPSTRDRRRARRPRDQRRTLLSALKKTARFSNPDQRWYLSEHQALTAQGREAHKWEAQRQAASPDGHRGVLKAARTVGARAVRDHARRPMVRRVVRIRRSTSILCAHRARSRAGRLPDQLSRSRSCSPLSPLVDLRSPSTVRFGGWLVGAADRRTRPIRARAGTHSTTPSSELTRVGPDAAPPAPLVRHRRPRPQRRRVYADTLMRHPRPAGKPLRAPPSSRTSSGTSTPATAGSPRAVYRLTDPPETQPRSPSRHSRFAGQRTARRWTSCRRPGRCTGATASTLADDYAAQPRTGTDTRRLPRHPRPRRRPADPLQDIRPHLAPLDRAPHRPPPSTLAEQLTLASAEARPARDRPHRTASRTLPPKGADHATRRNATHTAHHDDADWERWRAKSPSISHHKPSSRSPPASRALLQRQQQNQEHGETKEPTGMVDRRAARSPPQPEPGLGLRTRRRARRDPGSATDRKARIRFDLETAKRALMARRRRDEPLPTPATPRPTPRRRRPSAPPPVPLLPIHERRTLGAFARRRLTYRRSY